MDLKTEDHGYHQTASAHIKMFDNSELHMFLLGSAIGFHIDSHHAIVIRSHRPTNRLPFSLATSLRRDVCGTRQLLESSNFFTTLQPCLLLPGIARCRTTVRLHASLPRCTPLRATRHLDWPGRPRLCNSVLVLWKARLENLTRHKGAIAAATELVSTFQHLVNEIESGPGDAATGMAPCKVTGNPQNDTATVPVSRCPEATASQLLAHKADLIRRHELHHLLEHIVCMRVFNRLTYMCVQWR